MFRILQGLPRALRNKAQIASTTHHRSPAATQQNGHQDDGVDGHNKSPLSASLHPDHINRIVRLHTSASGQGEGEHAHRDEGKSFKHHNHWQSFRGTYNHFEAVGWGTAIIVSLQLCRALSTFAHPDSKSRRQQHGPKRVLSSIAYAMPMLHRNGPGLPMRVLDEKNTEILTDAKSKPRQNDAKETLETSEELNEAFQKLKSVSDESIGMAHNTLGLQEARQGNTHEAVQHFLKGSVLGYSKAKFNMAVCYEQGRGVEQDFTKAAELYQQAAEQGHAMAKYNLGVFHLLGRGDAVVDSLKALELITSAANQGLTQAQSYLGVFYMKEPHQDLKKAVELLKQAAMKHDTEALFHLGVCYQYGLGIECNTAKAASFYHKAASKGYVPALYSLGTFYEQGLGGLPENLQEAEKLYRCASQEGCREAALRLKQLRKEGTQRRLSSQDAQRQSVSKCTNKVSTLKHSKSQLVIENPIHTSSSEPVLGTTAMSRSSNVEQSSKNSPVAQQLSYLSLFLPYYYSKSGFSNVKNISTRAKREMDQRPEVVFQVGEEINESEMTSDYNCSSMMPVSNHLNTALLTVS